MEKSVYSISGMTCESCVKTITDRTMTVPGVATSTVSLEKKSIEIESSRKITMQELSNILTDLPKYKVSEINGHVIKKESLVKTYKPLITLFLFILVVTVVYQVSLGSFDAHIFMNHVMAGFFIGLSFFKFLDIKAFAESFSSYDPIAQRLPKYGYIYPFIELLLGLLFITGKYLIIANMMTIFILSITSYGVYQRLQLKSNFQCACLGTTFNLPLSNVTIAENVVMILMGMYGLFH